MNFHAHTAGERLEILIAEDSPTQAHRLRKILEKEGYLVTVATNGRLALEAAQRRKPAMVISDVIMPEMDGYEVCRRIKAEPGMADVPVILVTTMSDPQDVIRGLECRADNFILKPYEENDLLSRLQYVLVNRQMRQTEQSGMGLEIFFNGQRHFITADRLQILNLLLSTYDAAIQRNRELTRAQTNLQQVNSQLHGLTQELETRVTQRTQELVLANDALRKAHDQLEQRVRDRTAELQAANRELEFANGELESFSYSISHDLRAPLRHIDGFSQLVVEDYAAQLPADGQRLLQNVRAGAKKLGLLIDDLLAFSRLSRQPLVKRRVPLSALVEEVLADLQREREGRAIDLRIGTLPECLGDAALLKQVFINLLSNAFKFTRERQPAVVEIGCKQENGELTCHVRDNGAGFNMEYASKLFDVFQRLHRAEDFEGTGVGLSIVQRIVHRHGGRVWAEAEAGKGAVFYFTLPVPAEHG